MNNDFFGENSVSREQTQTEGALPFNSNNSGIRPVSMASVAMCQMIGNDTINQVLANKEIDFNNVQQLLEFIWLHAADPELVSACVVHYKEHPEYLKQEVLLWSMQFDSTQFLSFVKDIIKDKQNIANAKTEIIPEKGRKVRKNAQRQDS